MRRSPGSALLSLALAGLRMLLEAVTRTGVQVPPREHSTGWHWRSAKQDCPAPHKGTAWGKEEELPCPQVLLGRAGSLAQGSRSSPRKGLQCLWCYTPPLVLGRVPKISCTPGRRSVLSCTPVGISVGPANPKNTSQSPEGESHSCVFGHHGASEGTSPGIVGGGAQPGLSWAWRRCKVCDLSTCRLR